eukprot:7238688-Prymnesium_polylepis.1
MPCSHPLACTQAPLDAMLPIPLRPRHRLTLLPSSRFPPGAARDDRERPLPLRDVQVGAGPAAAAGVERVRAAPPQARRPGEAVGRRRQPVRDGVAGAPQGEAARVSRRSGHGARNAVCSIALGGEASGSLSPASGAACMRHPRVPCSRGTVGGWEAPAYTVKSRDTVGPMAMQRSGDAQRCK